MVCEQQGTLINFVNNNVKDTSIEARRGLTTTSTCFLMLELYRSNPKGFTDEEMFFELRKHNLFLPKSTISARRNDLKGDHGQPLVVDCGERRNSKYLKKNIVWKLNQFAR